MALYLVQHGKSLPKTEDPEKGLSPSGKEETVRIATVAEGYAVPVFRIKHSGKKRAGETAAIFADHLKPVQGVDEAVGIMPMDDPAAFAAALDPLDNAMVVGHLPFMERLVSLLVTGSTEKKIFKFQNSGIICLEREDGQWFIKWTLMPKIG
ncbi:MAG TPA: phosphohistidine phosphatase SixA [Desulfobacteraceae bacterium]|nr:phosphohistidine phosphatase SixA [Desulfobacteraceae bacterium]